MTFLKNLNIQHHQRLICQWMLLVDSDIYQYEMYRKRSGVKITRKFQKNIKKLHKNALTRKQCEEDVSESLIPNSEHLTIAYGRLVRCFVLIILLFLHGNGWSGGWWVWLYWSCKSLGLIPKQWSPCLCSPAISADIFIQEAE